MKVPITKDFDSRVVIGIFDGETGEMSFNAPQDILQEGVMAIGYTVAAVDVEEIDGVKFTRKAKIRDLSVVVPITIH
jgi:hypothetical protein